jgi:hypothetical protein
LPHILPEFSQVSGADCNRRIVVKRDVRIAPVGSVVPRVSPKTDWQLIPLFR